MRDNAMFLIFRLPVLLQLSALIFILSGSGPSFADAAVNKVATSKPIALDVYKDANCGCCNDWIHHANERGFTTRGHDIKNLYQFKLSKGIARENQSCHTAVSGEGYVFEGHVPARYVHRFLSAPPVNAIGLAVPAMPVGSPGMEYQNRFQPYQVLLLLKDGSTKIFAEVNSLEESTQ